MNFEIFPAHRDLVAAGCIIDPSLFLYFTLAVFVCMRLFDSLVVAFEATGIWGDTT